VNLRIRYTVRKAIRANGWIIWDNDLFKRAGQTKTYQNALKAIQAAERKNDSWLRIIKKA